MWKVGWQCRGRALTTYGDLCESLLLRIDAVGRQPVVQLLGETNSVAVYPEGPPLAEPLVGFEQNL